MIILGLLWLMIIVLRICHHFKILIIIMDTKYFAKVSKLVYKNKKHYEENRGEFEELGINNPNFLDVDNTECLIFERQGILIISFRGTNEFSDIMDNVNISRIPYYSRTGDYCGKIHKGFLNYYGNVKHSINEYIKKYIEDDTDDTHDKKIIFCGHSLGGSCCIAALDASYIENVPNIYVYTYGSPRIGNKTFAKKFNQRIYSIRIVNKYDPVPHLPFPIRFWHVELKMTLKHKFSFLKFFKIHFLIEYNIRKLINEHSIDEYIQKLV